MSGIEWQELHRIADPTAGATIVLCIRYGQVGLAAWNTDPDEPIDISPVTRGDLEALLAAYPEDAE